MIVQCIWYENANTNDWCSCELSKSLGDNWHANKVICVIVYGIVDDTKILTGYFGVQPLLQIINYLLSLWRRRCSGGMQLKMFKHLMPMGFTLRCLGVVLFKLIQVLFVWCGVVWCSSPYIRVYFTRVPFCKTLKLIFEIEKWNELNLVKYYDMWIRLK